MPIKGSRRRTGDPIPIDRKIRPFGVGMTGQHDQLASLDQVEYLVVLHLAGDVSVGVDRLEQLAAGPGTDRHRPNRVASRPANP